MEAFRELTDIERKFIDLWKAGTRTADIAVALERSVASVNYLRLKLSLLVDARMRGRPKVSKGSCVVCGKEIYRRQRYCSRECRAAAETHREPNERERQIIAMADDGKTLRQIARHFGFTPERARQLLARFGKNTKGLRRRKQPLANCVVCGQQFVSRTVYHKTKTCGLACHGEYMSKKTRRPEAQASRYRELPQVTCFVCGKEFVRGHISQAMHERKSCKRDFCSRDCYHRAIENQIEALGEAKSISDWARDPRCSVSASNIRWRLKHGMSAEDAITKPNRRLTAAKSREGTQ